MGLFITALAGCTNEKVECCGNPGDSDIPAEESYARLTIINGTRGRAAGGATQNTEGTESNIAGTVKVVIFKAPEGSFEKEYDLNCIGGVTDQFTISPGEKYIYVFSNNPALSAASGYRGTYERKILQDAFATADLPDIANNDFFIGTLWGKSVTVDDGGTVDTPVNIPLEIGRIAAKVKLGSIKKGDNSNMEGEFLTPEYRLGSVPRNYFLVGQHEGTIAPPQTGHGKVISAVHEESWENSSDPGKQNPVFTNYQGYKAVSQPTTPLTDFFYTIENTTKLDQQNHQYYGNTTYIQLKTQYEPTDAEIRSHQDISQAGSRNPDGTFYTIVIGGERYIVDDDPASTLQPDAGTEIKHYDKGLNYHKFAIRDKDERTDMEKQYSVIRNHYYEVAVTGIKDLGDPSEIVKPGEIIPQETTVTITVTVLPWSKIIQEEEI